MKPQIYHVVAVSKNHVIGKKNQLPWHFSSDMKHFKTLTTGHTVVMGRKTYESIPEKFRPLPDRENMVLSRSIAGNANGVLRYFDSIETALKNIRTKKAFIIGGASIYEQTLERIDGIYLTRIDQEYDGDAHYPEVSSRFTEISRTKLQDTPLIEVICYQKHNPSE